MAFNPDKCLKIKALQDDCFIQMTNRSAVDGSSYYFSKDGVNWSPDSIILQNGECTYVKGTNYPGKSSTNSVRLQFGEDFHAQVEIVSGNLMSLVDDGAGELTEITQQYGFCRVFNNGHGIKSIPSTLLPATTLAKGCYKQLFQFCDSLETIPSGLLPATTLVEECYSGMFDNCEALTSVPKGVLIAKTLVSKCYSTMFAGCISLKEIYVDFTAWPSSSTDPVNWVLDLPAEGDFYCPEELPEKRGVHRIPTGWTIHRMKPRTRGSLNIRELRVTIG